MLGGGGGGGGGGEVEGNGERKAIGVTHICFRSDLCRLSLLFRAVLDKKKIYPHSLTTFMQI